MSIKVLSLSELDAQPLEVREAIAFYASFTVLPIQFTAAEKAKHYKVLENAGYIERIS